MGFISRKVFPACGNMCVCCPALRPSSRQPVKRYKKLLGEIFPKVINGSPNERKIIKLCEYAAKNPIRIPKIAKVLEQRSYKEIRVENVNFLNIISLTYNKLLCICKEKMACFATSLLNVIVDLLDDNRGDAIKIIGCHTLTAFIYSQADNTYAHNIEALASKICNVARKQGGENIKRCLQAASLECLSAMVWYMSTFSYIFPAFGKIVHVILDNYEASGACFDGDDVEQESHLNWVEVIRSDARGAMGVCNNMNPKNMHLRPRPEIKHASDMTKEENENPVIWAQICMQKVVEMANNGATLRHILDPMFTYFDTGKHWDPRHGLSLTILSDISYLLNSSGSDQIFLAAIVRHLDHKNVVHDPQMKSDIVNIATCLVRHLGLQTGVSDIGIITDLCRHLRKSLQATVESAGLQESNLNLTLQNSIEDCILEISKRVTNGQALFDMMAITLEELPAIRTVSRATIGSLLILAHIISTSSFHSHLQVFPESLLLQLLKTMIHPDVETRIGAHQIFSVLLVHTASHQRNNGASFYQDYNHDQRECHSRNTTPFASATALLEKLRKEKETGSTDKVQDDTREYVKEKECADEDWKQSRTRKSSPNMYKISCSIIDRNTCSTSSTHAEPNIVALCDEQIGLLLSAFWIQTNQPDNSPSNIEAIAHSLSLTLLSARIRNSNYHNVLRTFQLLLSLQNLSLQHDGVLPPSSQVLLLMLSLSVLMFGGKTYHIPELCSLLKSLISKYVNPYMFIGDDLQLYVNPQANLKEYGSQADQKIAMQSLENLRAEVHNINQHIVAIIAQHLSNLLGQEVDDVVKQLSVNFTPEDGLLFGPNSILHGFYSQGEAHSDESLSFDEELSTCSSVNGDLASESPMVDPPKYVSSIHTLPSSPHILSVGQLLESALHVAGQVAGTAVSASPLPYGTMASQCETLGMDTRRKLSSWFSGSNDSIQDIYVSPINKDAASTNTNLNKIENESCASSDPWSSLSLPPASPFDNFLKAARY